MFWRKKLFLLQKNVTSKRGLYTVLAVCILNSNKKILASRRTADKDIIQRLGGVIPNISAIQHRLRIDSLIEQCLQECNYRISDLSAIAVTNKPGLVICLKVGADKALSDYRLNLIPIHHMQAHAITSRLTNNVEYPFVCLLISGGHTLIVVVRDCENFEIFGDTCFGGSIGECLDKLARELNLKPKATHYAATLEEMAKR